MTNPPDEIYIAENSSLWFAGPTSPTTHKYTLSTLTTELADALEALVTVADQEFGLRDHDQDYDLQTATLDKAKAALAKIGR